MQNALRDRFVQRALDLDHGLRGRLLVAGFPASPDWSDLPLKPEFVPMLLRAVEYLRRVPEFAASAAIAPGQPAPVTLTDRWLEARVQATDPSGKPHEIPLHRSARRLVGAMLQTDRKGYYAFSILPHAEGAPESVELGFAVNLAGEHNDFSMIDERRIRDILAAAPDLAYLESSPEKPILADELARKREIWRTLIWVTFLVICIEFLVSTLRPQRAVPSPGAGRQARSPAGWAGRIRRTLSAAPTGPTANREETSGVKT